MRTKLESNFEPECHAVEAAGVRAGLPAFGMQAGMIIVEVIVSSAP